MNETIRALIALLAGTVVLIVCYINVILKGKSHKQKLIEKAKATGNYTTATLIKNELLLGNDESGNANFKNDRMKCVYEYKVNGISYKKKITFQSPGMVAVKYPYSLTVYYDSNNPRKCVCPEEANSKSIGCFGTVALVIVTIAVVFYLLKLL